MYLGLSSIYVNVDTPNLGFTYFNFLGSKGTSYTFDIQKLILQWVSQYLDEIEQYNILIAAFDIWLLSGISFEAFSLVWNMYILMIIHQELWSTFLQFMEPFELGF